MTRPDRAAADGRATSCLRRATAGTRISSHIATRLTKIIELGTAAPLPRSAQWDTPRSPSKIAPERHGNERDRGNPEATRRGHPDLRMIRPGRQ
ncbi:hypothetical protein GCM10023403_29750 [Pseudonocardia benzenivorans]